jgi:hypothetical protein
MFYLLLLLFSWSAFSEDYQGRVLERGTKKVLSDVNVFLLPHKIKTTTSAKGDFTFTKVPEGECTFIINLTGYQKYERPCSKGTIYLEKISYTEFETTVTGKVTKRDDQGQTLTRDEFMKAPGSFGGDPVRAAQNLPGVAQSGANAQIIIQGASPDDTGYVINGHRVPIVFHFGGLSSVIIPEAVDRVDLLPSGYGPEYSRATGGIIGLTTKAPVKDRFHGMAFVDLLNSGALIEGPIDDKSSILIAGRYSYIGQVLKAVAKENEDFELTAAPSYYDFTTIYDRKLNDTNILKTTIVASKDQLELVLNKAANNDPDLRGNFFNATEFFRIIPQITTEIDSKTKMENSLGLGHDSIFVDIGGRYLDIDSNVISQRSEIAHEWSGKSKTYIGLDNYWQQARVKVNLPNNYSVGGVSNPFSTGENRKFEQESSQTFLGAYLRQELKPSEESKWTYLPNVRIDHFTINNDTRVQPRFQLRYQLDPKLLLRGSWGQYVQTPQPQETSRLYGNKNIRSPYAWHYTLGFTKDFRENGAQGLELTNNYFYKDLKDLVYPDIQKNYANSGTGSILGGEIQAKYRKDAWTSQIVYTYLKSTRHIPGFGTSPSEFDQTHNLNLIGSYNTERWTFSARFRYVTGNPYTPVTGSSFDADNDVFIPVRGGIYSERFDSFNQLDVRIDRKYIYDEWILTAYVDILNIYNSENSQNIEYSYDYSVKKKVRGLPILPTIGLKGEF